LDADYLYDEDKSQIMANIATEIERLVSMNIRYVCLQAFEDRDGDGNPGAVYFQTDKAPVLYDIFTPFIERAHQRGIKVLAWMPTLDWPWVLEEHPEWRVVAPDGQPQEGSWYTRASPFCADFVSYAEGLYEDLARHHQIDGVLFQDDCYLYDAEDFSPCARAAYEAAFGQPLDYEALMQDEALKWSWIHWKTESLLAFTDRLKNAVMKYRPNAIFAHDLYSDTALDPASEEWFAQSLPEVLNRGAYAMIMAYPYLDSESVEETAGGDREKWLELVCTGAKTMAGDRSHMILIKVQTVIWSQGDRRVPDEELAGFFAALQRAGCPNYGYYPDDLFENNPNPEVVRRFFSWWQFAPLVSK